MRFRGAPNGGARLFEQNSFAQAMPEMIQKARLLLQINEEKDLKMQEYYHITEPQRLEIDQETIERLKSLGFDKSTKPERLLRNLDRYIQPPKAKEKDFLDH